MQKIHTAVIGAGPYGLSMGAHLEAYNVDYRVFGLPMRTWAENMPQGMLLKSDGFASSLYAPQPFTLEDFCRERGIEYSDLDLPVSLSTFVDYGREFQRRKVSALVPLPVTRLSRHDDLYRLTLEDGGEYQAARVVMAVGIGSFAFTPPPLRDLPQSLATHSVQQRELSVHCGRRVAVVGGGASASDLAALLHEAGAHVTLITRRPSLDFHTAPSAHPQSLWWHCTHPNLGLGPNFRSAIFTLAPGLFRHLPDRLRSRIVRRHLGPAGGWFMRERVLGAVDLLTGAEIATARPSGDGVELTVSSTTAGGEKLMVDHVVAATGYVVDLTRLTFVDPDLRAAIRTVDGSPRLSARFESSVPALYFVGLASAQSFGPLMRFAVGARYSVRKVAAAIQPEGCGTSVSSSAESVPPADPDLQAR